MKILFWLLAILSLPVGWFLSYTSYLMNGLRLPGTIIGEIACIAGIPALLVSILCSLSTSNRKTEKERFSSVLFRFAPFFDAFINDALKQAQIRENCAGR